jgi:arginyl-tRNA synthetase
MSNMNLIHHIQEIFRSALQGLVPDVEPYVAMIKPTQDLKHGNYQANCAMPLAKALGKKPRDIAQDIVNRLHLGNLLEKPEIAGPGFINLRLQTSWLAKQVQIIARDDRLGVILVQPAKTFVIDYSSPNVAKPMHVGHLRSTIIGDALARLLRFLGHTVIADNHLGDWGTQFGMMLFAFKNYRSEKSWDQDPLRELLRLYVMVREISKPADEEDDEAQKRTYTEDAMQVAKLVMDASRKETAKLHAGDEENLRLWKAFMPYCLKELEPIYERMDIRFDHQHGESFYNPLLAAVVKDLELKQIAQRSNGALVVFFGENDPPAVVQKGDGAFAYTTTDLATIQYRVEHFRPHAMLYVVDFRQGHHFKQLFETARRWGYDKVELQHISFGSVLGPDKKPIKTREGGSVELGTLLDEAVQRGRQVVDANSPELPEEQRAEVAEVVGIGAVKYADLCQNRTSDYVFSWDKMLAMEGNTGTYMQYAYARNRSILAKASANAEALRRNPPAVALDTPFERALALQLLRLEESLLAAAEEYQPSLITAYLWDLAKTYSGFFQNCPVIRAESDALKQSRLLLCDLTARVLQRCLHLLGIRTVERM